MSALSKGRSPAVARGEQAELGRFVQRVLPELTSKKYSANRSRQSMFRATELNQQVLLKLADRPIVYVIRMLGMPGLPFVLVPTVHSSDMTLRWVSGLLHDLMVSQLVFQLV